MKKILGFKLKRPVLFTLVGVALCVSSHNMARAANGSVVYTYDALGRVSTASYDTNVIVIYTYDANGNRTQQVINVNSATLTWTVTVTPCTANCWGAVLW
jgi:YD repeat-containing protein